MYSFFFGGWWNWFARNKQYQTIWQRAGGVLIPKEKDSVDTSQFCNINLLNVDGKIFFSVVAPQLAVYLEKKLLLRHNGAESRESRFSVCLEHTNRKWHQIQVTKKNERDLHTVFLDLANAITSVPHIVLWAVFNFLNIREAITDPHQILLPGCTALPDNWGVHHSMAASGSKYHGRIHHLPTSLHHGGHHPSLLVGVSRRAVQI